jgi:hypothetical protein
MCIELQSRPGQSQDIAGGQERQSISKASEFNHEKSRKSNRTIAMATER